MKLFGEWNYSERPATSRVRNNADHSMGWLGLAALAALACAVAVRGEEPRIVVGEQVKLPTPPPPPPQLFQRKFTVAPAAELPAGSWGWSLRPQPAGTRFGKRTASEITIDAPTGKYSLRRRVTVDGLDDYVEAAVEFGDASAPPPLPPPPPVGKIEVFVVRPPGPFMPAIRDKLLNPAWSALKAKPGVAVWAPSVAELDEPTRAAVGSTALPCVVVMSNGKVRRPAAPLPADADVPKLLEATP